MGEPEEKGRAGQGINDSSVNSFTSHNRGAGEKERVETE